MRYSSLADHWKKDEKGARVMIITASISRCELERVFIWRWGSDGEDRILGNVPAFIRASSERKASARNHIYRRARTVYISGKPEVSRAHRVMHSVVVVTWLRLRGSKTHIKSRYGGTTRETLEVETGWLYLKCRDGNPCPKIALHKANKLSHSSPLSANVNQNSRVSLRCWSQHAPLLNGQPGENTIGRSSPHNQTAAFASSISVADQVDAKFLAAIRVHYANVFAPCISSGPDS